MHFVVCLLSCRKFKSSTACLDFDTGNGRTVLTVARNTTINLVCTDGTRYPTWFVNGITVGTGDQCNRTSFSNEEMVTATLTIDWNYCICDTLNIHCEFYVDEERRLVSLHNTTLTIQG